MPIIIQHDIKIDRNIPLACVYRLTLDTGHYYIGATSNISKRVSHHNTILKKRPFIYHSLYKKIYLTGATKCRLTIIETFASDKVKECFLLEAETIKFLASDPFLLNHINNAKTQTYPGRPMKLIEDKKVPVIFYVPQKRLKKVRIQCAELIKIICEPVIS